MTEKTYTGKEFAPVFYRAMAEWYEGGRCGIDPRLNWQCGPDTRLDLNKGFAGVPSFFEPFTYRWAPLRKRMVTIGYATDGDAVMVTSHLVAPENVAPKFGAAYFTDDGGTISEFTWANDILDKARLRKGSLFLTREDAKAMSAWLAACRNGGAV